jgi:hypothetical protein
LSQGSAQAADTSPPTNEWDVIDVTGILSAVIIGLVMGVLAKLVVPGGQKTPIWLTILVSTVDAVAIASRSSSQASTTRTSRSSRPNEDAHS